MIPDYMCMHDTVDLITFLYCSSVFPLYMSAITLNVNRCNALIVIVVCFQVLALSQTTVGQLTIGHVVNLASNDVHRFDMVSGSKYLLKNFNKDLLIMGIS